MNTHTHIYIYKIHIHMQMPKHMRSFPLHLKSSKSELNGMHHVSSAHMITTSLPATCVTFGRK